jgi:4-amino-4-deoxy-L-arabinose transferase-like glycosyltransferase
MMHSYLVLGVFAPYMVGLIATDRLTSPSAAYPYGFSDPVAALRDLSMLAHFLSVLLGAGVVLATFVAGRTLWGNREGVWAAAMVLLMYPMFFYSRTSNVDVPTLFFVAWSVAALARLLTLGFTRRRVAAFGALAGLAVATKEPAAALYLGLPLLLLVPHEEWAGFRDPRAVARMALVGLGCAFVAYAVGSGMVLDFVRWKAHIYSSVVRTADVARGAIVFTTAWPTTLEGHVGLVREIVVRLGQTLTPPGLVLSVAGMAAAFRSARRSTWLLVMATTYLLTLFLVARSAHLRYVLPAAFFLAMFSGVAVARALRSGVTAIRWSGAWAAAVTIAIAVLWATNLTHAMIRDSRYAAGRWIAAVARPGDRLEYFGAMYKNPPLPREVASGHAIEYLGGEIRAPRDDATVERIRAGWRERAPRFILLTPDLTSLPGEPYPQSCPPQIYRDLEDGVLGYVRAELFVTPPLIGFIGRPSLDYQAVNPEVHIYVQRDDPALSRAGT